MRDKKAASFLIVLFLAGTFLLAFEISGVKGSGSAIVFEEAHNPLWTVAGGGAEGEIGGTEIEIAYDDGAKEATTYCYVVGGIFAVRFTPSVFGQLKRCSFYVDSNPLEPVKIHVMDSEKTDLITPFNYDLTSSDWIDVDLSAYEVSVGSGIDFYIGLEGTVANAPELGRDNSDPDGRSWKWSPLTEEWSQSFYEEGDFMIRATVAVEEQIGERYALLVSGGFNSDYNYPRYLGDLGFIYDTLVNFYMFEEDHVKTIYYDGSSQDLDGDGDNDVNYAATEANFNASFNAIKASLSGDDLFFIFVTDHGYGYDREDDSAGEAWYSDVLSEDLNDVVADEDGYDEGICLWDSDGDGKLGADELLYDYELADLAVGTPGTVVFVLAQCFSGGFIDDLSANNRIIMTACLEEETSLGTFYDFFAYHWTTAMQGVDADVNSDDQISMQEAFDYAVANDEAYTSVEYESNETETCQIDDPNGIAGTITLGARTRVALFPVADTFVNSALPDSNFGGEDHLSADITSGSSRYYNYTYIMFDLSLLPGDAVIESADLSLFAWEFAGQIYTPPGPKIYAHYCSDNSWTELGITWNNKPAFDSVATSYIDPPVLGYNIWDVTEDAVIAVSSGKITEVLKWPDYTQVDAWAWIDFRSREEFYFNSQLHRGFKPKLIVEYSLQPPSKSAYLVVRGSNNYVYFREYNPATDDWGSWVALPGATVDAPAAAILDNQLHIVVRGMDGATLWWGYYDLETHVFSGFVSLAGSSPSSPVLTSNGEKMCLVVHGSDDLIYYRVYSTGAWGSWQLLPDGSTIDSPAAALLGDELHVIVRGMDGYSMWHKIIVPEGSVVQEWTWIPGSSASPPVLTASQSRGELYMLVRGADDGIYECAYDGSWGGWTSLQGLTVASPAATVCGDELHVIVRGSDAVTLWHGVVDLDSAVFGGWSYISGSTPSRPVLTS